MKLITKTQLDQGTDSGGKWVEFETMEGEKISFRLRFLNPKEKMGMNRFTYNAKNDEMSMNTDETYQRQIDIARKAIQEWKGLSDHLGNEIPYSVEVLKDDVFMYTLYHSETKEGKKIGPFICDLVTDPLAFHLLKAI